jgi:hypothetical protein
MYVCQSYPCNRILAIYKTNTCILKVHSHSMSAWRFNLSFSRVPLLFLNSWRVSFVPYYVTTHPLQLFKNSTDAHAGKLRLNLHSLSVSELLEYRRKL